MLYNTKKKHLRIQHEHLGIARLLPAHARAGGRSVHLTTSCSVCWLGVLGFPWHLTLLRRGSLRFPRTFGSRIWALGRRGPRLPWSFVPRPLWGLLGFSTLWLRRPALQVIVFGDDPATKIEYITTTPLILISWLNKCQYLAELTLLEPVAALQWYEGGAPEVMHDLYSKHIHAHVSTMLI